MLQEITKSDFPAALAASLAMSGIGTIPINIVDAAPEVVYGGSGDTMATMSPLLRFPGVIGTSHTFDRIGKLPDYERSEDHPQTKVQEGLPLVTFHDQLFALQHALYRNNERIAVAVAGGTEALARLQTALYEDPTSDLFTRGQNLFLMGAANFAFARAHKGEAADASGASYPASRHDFFAAQAFLNSGEFFIKLRAFHATALAYEAAIHSFERYAAQNAKEAAGQVRLHDSSKLGASFAWMQSVCSDNDPMNYEHRLARGIVAAYGTGMAGRRAAHSLMQRSYELNVRRTFNAEAANDSMRMAWRRLAEYDDPEKLEPKDWSYIASMTKRASDRWASYGDTFTAAAARAMGLSEVARGFAGASAG